MSGRKKKQRVESNPTSSHLEGVSTSPPAGKKRRGGRGEPALLSRRLGTLALQATLAGLILGVLMVYVSLSSVASSDDTSQLRPGPSQASGANPGAVPAANTPRTTSAAATPPPSGATAPARPPAQGVDPQRVELRTKGDPQAPVVVTEWFDFL